MASCGNIHQSDSCVLVHSIFQLRILAVSLGKTFAARHLRRERGPDKEVVGGHGDMEMIRGTANREC